MTYNSIAAARAAILATDADGSFSRPSLFGAMVIIQRRGANEFQVSEFFQPGSPVTFWVGSHHVSGEAVETVVQDEATARQYGAIA